MKHMLKIDFGTIGLKIGDEIMFQKNGRKFIVASGNGTPGNGGTLVRYDNDDDTARAIAALETSHEKPEKLEKSYSGEVKIPYEMDFSFGYLMPLRYITRKMLGAEFDESVDIWSLWEFEGETLKSIYRRKIAEHRCRALTLAKRENNKT